jgi:hypothetical protein
MLLISKLIRFLNLRNLRTTPPSLKSAVSLERVFFHNSHELEMFRLFPAT